MNFTLALLGGLVLIAPGLVGLAAWQLRASEDGARRTEIPLTSATGLVMVLITAFTMHIFGWALIEAGLQAGRELGAFLGRPDLPPAPDNPYTSMARLAEGHKNVSLPSIIAFCVAVAGESGLVAAIATSQGAAVILADVDLANQGWVFRHVVRPTRSGMKPIAFVLTTPDGDGGGLAYRGVIIEARQGANGELAGITLANPDAFGYRVGPQIGAPQNPLRLSTTARRTLTGALNLEADMIRNVLVQFVPDDVIDDVFNDLPPAAEPDDSVFARALGAPA